MLKGGKHRQVRCHLPDPSRAARLQDTIRTGKDCGIGKYPSTALVMNKAWQVTALTAATLLAWLMLLPLDGSLARAEPEALRYRILRTAARITRSGLRRPGLCRQRHDHPSIVERVPRTGQHVEMLRLRHSRGRRRRLLVPAISWDKS
jgi:hypothetical protein